MNFKKLDNGETAIAITSIIFKQKELVAFIDDAFKDSGMNRLKDIILHSNRGEIPLHKSQEIRDAWLGGGIDCEILNPNSAGWEKGKVRIKVSLEFCSNEQVESPSDPLGPFR